MYDAIALRDGCRMYKICCMLDTGILRKRSLIGPSVRLQFFGFDQQCKREARPVPNELHRFTLHRKPSIDFSKHLDYNLEAQ